MTLDVMIIRHITEKNVKEPTFDHINSAYICIYLKFPKLDPIFKFDLCDFFYLPGLFFAK